ncbi:MAG: metallophosphoesterase [Chloroflexota bacterium]
MKILAVSDKVLDYLYSTQVSKNFPDIDLLIGCGDLPFYYLDFLNSALNSRAFYVRGNHDKGPQYTIHGKVYEKLDGGVDLHGKTAVFNRIIFAGLEGSMRYRPNAPFMYTEGEMRSEIARMLPSLLYNRLRYGRFLDVLVTHSPPFGIHDKNDLPHTGFRAFLPFLRWFRPKYMLHGHIHIYRQDTIRQTKFLDTTILNVYPYQIIEL